MNEKPAVEEEDWEKVNDQKAMDGSFWLTQFCCIEFKIFLTNTLHQPADRLSF